MVDVMRWRVHDLLMVDPDLTEVPSAAPDWAPESLAVTPWVVVRRDITASERIPVGVRGERRSQRYGFELDSSAVRTRVRPDELSGMPAPHRALPAFDALAAAQSDDELNRWHWGPTGSVGFELASSSLCVHAASDLDIAVFTDHLDLPSLGALHASLHALPVRVDCTVELPCGAVSLTELVRGSDQVLVKTSRGARLVDAHALTS
jgi:phosphoribosyl-dephospho-CoA transferase